MRRGGRRPSSGTSSSPGASVRRESSAHQEQPGSHRQQRRPARSGWGRSVSCPPGPYNEGDVVDDPGTAVLLGDPPRPRLRPRSPQQQREEREPPEKLDDDADRRDLTCDSVTSDHHTAQELYIIRASSRGVVQVGDRVGSSHSTRCSTRLAQSHGALLAWRYSSWTVFDHWRSSSPSSLAC